MYRFRPWPKPPSTPIARWGSPCAAAISAKAWRASWRSVRRGLRGSEGVRTVVQQPVFAQVGFAGHHASPFGITWLRHAKPEGRSVRRGLLESELLPKPVFAQVGFAGHASLFGHHVAAPRVARRAKRGGARRDRTADLVIANDALSQLSYGPIAADANLNDGGQQSAPFTIRVKVK